MLCGAQVATFALVGSASPRLRLWGINVATCSADVDPVGEYRLEMLLEWMCDFAEGMKIAGKREDRM